MIFIWKLSSIYGNYIPLFYFCLLKASTKLEYPENPGVCAVHDSSTLKHAGQPGDHS